MKYVSEWTAITIGTAANRVWEWNNMEDLDLTGVGHQPLYYDEMNQIYLRNRVRAAKIMVEVANQAAVPVEITISPQHVATAPVTAFINELPYARHRISSDVNQGAPIVRVSNYMTYRKSIGSSVRNFLNQAQAGVAVDDGEFFNIHYQNLDGSTINLLTRTTIICYAQFFEPKQALQGAS